MSPSATQRASVLIRPRTSAIQEIALRAPAPTEVRVRLQGCGICASSLAVWEGRPWFRYPLAAGAPGHEGWGLIDEIGPEVTGFQPGERVAFVSGCAYAQFDIVPQASLVRLPDELANLPFPGEPLGCAMNIWQRSDIRSGHRVAIVGAGFLGLLLTQLATRAGAEVVALSRRPYALELARRAGAKAAFGLEDADAAKAAAWDYSNGRGYERVIEAAGLQSTLDLASALAGEYGRLVIAGYHQDGFRQVNMQEWNWRGLDVVNAHERDPARYVSGMQRAIGAVLGGQLDPFPFLTHRVPLESLDEGFELTRSRPDGFVKAVMQLELA